MMCVNRRCDRDVPVGECMINGYCIVCGPHMHPWRLLTPRQKIYATYIRIARGIVNYLDARVPGK
jgi:hypothetical protein